MTHDWTNYCVRHLAKARVDAGTRHHFRRLLRDRWELFARTHDLPVTDPAAAGFVPSPTTSACPCVNGPGSQLKILLARFGAKAVGCVPCNDYATQMNLWGIAGVRARREEIKAWLKSNGSWGVTFTAIARGAMTGLLFKLNPLDPLGSLIDWACQLAEESCREG